MTRLAGELRVGVDDLRHVLAALATADVTRLTRTEHGSDVAVDSFFDVGP